MDDTRAAQIRGRLSKATPGPWGHFVDEWRPATPVAVHRIGSNETGEDIACVYLTRPRDADLIANAPADLADLLDEREILIADRQSAEQVADDYHEEILAAHAERDRLLAVVEAAIAMEDVRTEPGHWSGQRTERQITATVAFRAAVRAYRTEEAGQ